MLESLTSPRLSGSDCPSTARPYPPARPRSQTARSNSVLCRARAEVAAILRDALSTTKQLAVAAGLAVHPSLVSLWCMPAQSDRKPAPLALLLVLDDDAFEATIAGVRAARREAAK